MHLKAYNDRSRSWISPLLLVLIIMTLFAMPHFPEGWQPRLYALFFTAIFLCAAYMVRGKRSLLFSLSLVIIVATGISSFVAEGSFKSVTRLLQFAFFVLLVIALIRQISASPDVTGIVIIDAVAAYLLLGFAFGIMVLVSNTTIKDAYSDPLVLNTGDTVVPDIRDAMYYAFTTYTTTGYGDILPRHPISKSLSTLISICGQLYVAIILALLVGKFASRKQEPTNNT
jgi:hypothetical protein